MKIVVCVKPVPDTSSAPRIDASTKRLIREAVPTIINPFDEFALEAAFRLRDADASHSVTVISLAPAFARESLRKTLAVGADDAVHLTDDAFAGSDGAATARILAAALRVIGFDLIVCGTQSADGGGGYLPTLLAGLLELPAITSLRALRIDGDRIVGERNAEGVVTRLSCDAPVLVSVGKELGAPRYASLKGIMAAKKKEIRVLDASAIGAGPTCSKTELLEAAAPPPKERCRLLQAAEPAAAAAEIVAFLRERRAI